MSRGPFGALLRELRTTAGLTQEGLAEQAGISVEAVRTLESGRRRYPRPSTIEQLATALAASDDQVAALSAAAARRSATDEFGPFPQDLSDFVGRSDQLRSLVETLAAPGVVVAAVTGMGGIGKTTLAVRAAHLSRHVYPDGCIFLSLGSGAGRPLEPAAAVRTVLTKLGAPAGSVPSDVREAAGRLRSALAGRRILLVLDDAADPSQLTPLIPGTPGCSVLVTSRQALLGLTGAKHFRLDALGDDEAAELLAAEVGQERCEAEPAAARELISSCGRHPLALRLTGSYLAGKPDLELAAVANRLAGKQEVLSFLGGEQSAFWSSVTLAIEAVAEGIHPGDAAAADALPLLALLDGEEFSLRIAAAVLELPLVDTEVLLDRLIDVHLLETPEWQRYRMHDLVLAVGRELAERSLDDSARQAARKRALDCYGAMVWRHTEFGVPGTLVASWWDRAWAEPARDIDSPEELRDALDADRLPLLQLVRAAAAGTPAERLAAVRIAVGYTPFVLARRRWIEWRDLNSAVVEAAAELDDPIAEAAVQFNLGVSHNMLRDYKLGVAPLERALELTRQVGNPNFETLCLMHLATSLEETGELAAAFRYAERCLELALQTGDAEDQADSHLLIGCLLARAGDWAGQRSAFEQGMAIARQKVPTVQTANFLVQIARSFRDTGQFEAAVPYGFEALELQRLDDGGEGPAQSLEELSASLIELGRYDEAVVHLTEALELATERDRAERASRVRTLLGRALAATGKLDEARTHWEAAWSYYTRHGLSLADEVRALLDAAADGQVATVRRVVVGVAVIRDGKVLAALRAGPDGGWEFPGGKVEPGETDQEAAVRELAEELALEITVGPSLGPGQPIGKHHLLRVYAAELVAGEPVLHEHAEIRWVGPAELEDLGWLPADRPFLPALRARLSADT